MRSHSFSFFILISIMAVAANSDHYLLPRTMEKFFKEHVSYDDKLMKENQKIVLSFMNDLKAAITENVADLPISVSGYERQGSAFEGLKCGAPDEFDFAIQIKIKKKAGDFVYVEGRSIGASLPDSDKAAGFWKIELKSEGKKEIEDKWRLFTEPFPGGNRLCLSPRKVVQRVQSVIDKFLGPKNGLAADMANLSVAGASNAPYWRSQVSRYRRQTRGNPALTVTLTKRDGSDIDVDVSPCIIDSKGQHFVPKRHPRLRGRQLDSNDPYEKLWMKTESQKELKHIAKMDSDGGDRKKVMRVLKAALASKDTPFNQFHSSYIIKTAWLHIVDKFPGKEKWQGWEVLSLRLRDILTELENSFKNKKLVSRFNPQENVLVRFNDPFLTSCEGFLSRLNTKLKMGQISRFIEDLGLDGSGKERRRSHDEL